MNLEIILYAAEALLVAAALVSAIIYSMCKDTGYLIISLIFAISAVLSFYLSAWWPIAGGVAATVALLFFGSGRGTGRDNGVS